jgi:hypothetical protein
MRGKRLAGGAATRMSETRSATWKAKQALLFLKKKKQKDFGSLKHLALTVTNPAGAQVFCFFFSKKKRLLPLTNTHANPTVHRILCLRRQFATKYTFIRRHPALGCLHGTAFDGQILARRKASGLSRPGRPRRRRRAGETAGRLGA